MNTQNTKPGDIDPQTQIELEAQTFRRLVAHLQNSPDVQNIDLMVLASFCRNCLSKWYKAAAQEKGIEVDYDSAREYIYGMPYEQWKDAHQTKASDETMRAYEKKHPKKPS